MGKILIFLILAVTIPRWALTLEQVDTFQLLGVPIAAIGEAIVLELGNFYLLRIYNRCRARALDYRARWNTLNEQNLETGKKTRKPKNDPLTTGHGILPVALLAMEVLTVAAQTPFIAGTLLDQTATSLLEGVHPAAVIGYALLLVISPGLMTVAIGFGIHYEESLKGTTTDKERGEVWYHNLARSLTDRLTRRIQQADRPAPATVQVSDRPTDLLVNRPTRQRPDSDQPDTQAGQVSNALAGHLVTLKEALSRRAQTSPSYNGHFRRKDIENLLKLGSTQAKTVLRYGLEHELLEETGRFVYAFTN